MSDPTGAVVSAAEGKQRILRIADIESSLQTRSGLKNIESNCINRAAQAVSSIRLGISNAEAQVDQLRFEEQSLTGECNRLRERVQQERSGLQAETERISRAGERYADQLQLAKKRLLFVERTLGARLEHADGVGVTPEDEQTFFILNPSSVANQKVPRKRCQPEENEPQNISGDDTKIMEQLWNKMIPGEAWAKQEKTSRASGPRRKPLKVFDTNAEKR